MNLPGVVVDLPTMTAKDVDDIINWGCKYGVDFIAASFVRKGSDVTKIRDVLHKNGGEKIKIISKIENLEGLENFADILAETDGVMVARGDLGMEIPLEKVFLAQKMMIRECNLAGKAVVTATQMLESMIVNPRPTRAECSDVANAVLDGTDCVMLSGETAGGEHPTAAVTIMARTCVEAEGALNYDNLFQAVRNSSLLRYGSFNPSESVASSAVKTAIDIKAKAIIVCTESGATAAQVAKFRPSMPIVVITVHPTTARQCYGILKGVDSRLMESIEDTDSVVAKTIEDFKEAGKASTGDNFVLLFGKVAVAGSTNSMKIVTA